MMFQGRRSGRDVTNVFAIPGNGSWSIVSGGAPGDWWRPDMRGQPGRDWSAEGSVGQWRPAVDMRHSSPAHPLHPSMVSSKRGEGRSYDRCVMNTE